VLPGSSACCLVCRLPGTWPAGVPAEPTLVPREPPFCGKEDGTMPSKYDAQSIPICALQRVGAGQYPTGWPDLATPAKAPVRADSYELMPVSGQPPSARSAGHPKRRVKWPVRSGLIPPLAEGFSIPWESVPGLEQVLLPGSAMALVPALEAVNAPDWRAVAGKTQLAAYAAQSLRWPGGTVPGVRGDRPGTSTFPGKGGGPRKLARARPALGSPPPSDPEVAQEPVGVLQRCRAGNRVAGGGRVRRGRGAGRVPVQ
jgi:hypothetical protein